MLFKDRVDAGRQLAALLVEREEIARDKESLVVVSILRGGIVVGVEVAKKFAIPHCAIIVAKIAHPKQSELAIGAVCEGEYFFDKHVIQAIPQDDIDDQIKKAEQKITHYKKIYGDRELDVLSKKVLLIDDGVATGATVNVAGAALRKKGARAVFLASPVIALDFDATSFDGVYFLHQEADFRAISQFYEEFPQVSDAQVKEIMLGIQEN
ncbi:MAG TPA: phosphoribosyltransferase family protein [Patescibacteria group bacterium]|nr:phosphoribosyltransferase family protein [Patescibacteria group bacterium]